MNALIVAAVLIVWLVLGYKIYGRFLEKKVILPDDDSCDPTIDFGYNSPCTGIIGDFVWYDKNRNGIQDAGEPGTDSAVEKRGDDRRVDTT